MKKMTISKMEKPHYNVFAQLSERKKATVEEMGFGALRHIPKLNVSHKLLRELILCFDLYHRFLDTRYGKV
ncbi:hypothetical protein AHAS_Ahas14G0140400 [Arachis hypogaea]